MTSVNELRFTFLCPAKGTISLGTELVSIKKGYASVLCQACGGAHTIQATQTPEKDEQPNVEQLANKLESLIADIGSAVDDLENATSNAELSVEEAQETLNTFRTYLTRDEAA